jgi:hypothetical protein
MELHDQIKAGTVATLQEIANTLQKHGITVTLPKDPHCYLDWNTLTGTHQGATIYFSTSTHSHRLSLKWGPYIKSHNINGKVSYSYEFLKFGAETYASLLTRFAKQMRKIPPTAPRGPAAVLAWVAYRLAIKDEDSIVYDVRRQIELGCKAGHDYNRFPFDINNAELRDAIKGKNVAEFAANHPIA